MKETPKAKVSKNNANIAFEPTKVALGVAVVASVSLLLLAMSLVLTAR